MAFDKGKIMSVRFKYTDSVYTAQVGEEGVEGIYDEAWNSEFIGVNIIYKNKVVRLSERCILETTFERKESLI